MRNKKGQFIKGKRPEWLCKRIGESLKGKSKSKEFKENLSRVRTGCKLSEETKRKIGKAHIGNKNPQWNGGRFKDNSNGYIFVMAKDHPLAKKNGYVAEHRLVIEKKIGRYLKKSEIVHHINGIKDDNRIKNLVITSRKEHKLKYHKKNK